MIKFKNNKILLSKYITPLSKKLKKNIKFIKKFKFI